ncbi:MAG: arylsulfatase [Phycisphaeraceae bacterium]|nr:arylsulfatase [Phycisphaeraceae bacterium]
MTQSNLEARSNPRPNILLIMTDQQRGDCLGCDGHPVLETPYLDELASKGTRFAKAYTASPSCLPARATLLTGMSQWRTGILGMGRGQGQIPNTFKHTMPGELAKAGYHTQAIGKNHFDPYRALNGYHNCIIDESSRVPDSDYFSWFAENKTGPYGYRDHSVGWNSWMARPTHLPEHMHPTHWTAQQAIDWLPRRDPSAPFFLKVSFARPHSPFDPPQVYYDMYKDRRMPDPVIGDWCDDPTGSPQSNDTDAWQSKRTDAEIQRARACYYGNITFIDHQIGRLLYHMQKDHAQALANTMIIFVSDHGDMMGDHHLWRKTYGFEGSARVPMIVVPPANASNVLRNQVRQEIVELRDIMPTVLAAAGVPIPETCVGMDMLPLTQDGPVDWRNDLHGEHCQCYAAEQANHYLTDGQYKYLWMPYTGKQLLFDLDTDPGECHDLSEQSQHTETLQRMRQRLAEILKERGSTDLLDEAGDLRILTPEEFWTSPNYRKFNMQASSAVTD